MAETRYALPYISHLRVTKRPTQNWVPAGYQNQEGQDLYKQVMDLPGIECEITPYMGSVKGPATQYRFPSKAFFEDALAELEVAPVTEQTTNAKIQIEATLARTDVVWAENVLLAGGLPALEALWQGVFSDALDAFPAWAEPTVTNGILLTVKEMQWDARIPADGSKSISLKVGTYVDTNPTPTITTLLFEDAATRTQRLAYATQLQNRITQLTTDIAKLPAGPSTERTQREMDLERQLAEKAQRDAVEIGSLPALVANPSVMASLPVLLMSIIGVLKAQSWPTLDMAVVQERLTVALSAMLPTP